MQLSFCNHKHRVGFGMFGKLQTYETWGGWEVWRFIKNNKGENFIITSLTDGQKLLRSDKEGEAFRADKKKLGIGAATIAAAVVMPFAVTGVVGAMGYGTGGISAGSMAAGMMSAEAIASGGAVAAGGTVATLQSIGVIGLGAAGTGVAAGAGAVVGGLSALCAWSMQTMAWTRKWKVSS